MEDAHLHHPGGVALLANRLVVDGDLFALRTVVVGEMRLSTAQVGGIVLLDKAVIADRFARRLLTSSLLRASVSVRRPYGRCPRVTGT